MIVIFSNYILHFTFQYFLLIKRRKPYLLTLKNCQLYIKALLIYSLKMAS